MTKGKVDTNYTGSIRYSDIIMTPIYPIGSCKHFCYVYYFLEGVWKIPL